MLLTILFILIAFFTGLIIGYQAYATNLKREGWIPIWNWNKPVGQGRLTMIEPAERMTPAEMIDSLYKYGKPFLEPDQVDKAYQEMVRNFTANRRGND